MSAPLARALKLALTGIETRYVTALYLHRVGLVGFVIATTVLAIDIAGNLDRVLAAAGPEAPAAGPARIALYLLLRLAYNAPAILPLATAVGIVWAEVSLARSHERTILANTGRSPLVSLVPALLVGLLVGAAQFAALDLLRPLSVEAQGQMGFRAYGPRLSGPDRQPRWVTLDRAILHARIGFADGEALLQDVTLYTLDSQLRLESIQRAAQARLADGGLDFENPQRWPDTGEAISPPVDPIWLRNIGIDPRFVTQSDLRHLARGGAGIQDFARYRAALQDRRAAPLRTAAMALLMATLCLVVLRPRGTAGSVLMLMGAGYGFHFVVQTLSILAESGVLAPGLGVWAVPAGVIAGCIAFNLWREARVARVLARHRKANASVGTV